MPTQTPAKGASLSRLVSIMERLLAPDGCPWDREQTLESLKPYLVEEAYEVLEVMDGEADQHCEELGDLMFQVVFHAAIREGRGEFAIDDVVTSIADKLERRHPHVFGDARIETEDELKASWDRIKAEEKGGDRRVLDGIPKALPALLRAQKLSSRAARVGFDWPTAADCLAKVREEVDEVTQAMDAADRDAVVEEVGDLLFATVSLARKLGVDAEGALRDAGAKFESRFRYVEDRLAADGVSPDSATLEHMDALWNDAKAGAGREP